ncbi:MAG: hypothetical protein HON90_03470, partial [Halobacteriovoraceae bacterium]|nr:hypothetical protein [Halobacteriovoraceae bacterium]
LKTHLIGAPDKVGIVDDDYDKFFSKRISLISKELEKRVILTDADNVIEGLDEDTEVDNISDEEGFEE